ncbi:MAG: ABC transporter permease, partial [Vallitaleaceae bacterium]|nr:ABC transporter permease [Vallitaleaceae bacterium]
LFKMARENLFRRKLRTGLTILSIVIGTVSIVLMIALGIGIQDNVKKEFSNFGTLNVLEVSKGKAAVKTDRFNENKDSTGLTDSDVQFLSDIKGVEAVAPTISTTVKLTTSNHESYVNMIGFDPSLMGQFGFKVKLGSLLQDNDSFEAVFGDKAVENFKKKVSDNPNAAVQRPDTDEVVEEDQFQMTFGPPPDKAYPFEPLEERYKLSFDLQSLESDRLFSLDGVGVLKEGDSMKDYNVYVPLNLLQKLLKSYNEAKGIEYSSDYSQISVKVTDMNEVNTVKTYIESMGYSVFSLMSILESINKTLGVLQIALGAIGGISLFVAGIGITNTMVMAITERKKEIGIMKVIGATVKDIKRLFLLEASMIGLLGGIFGIALCIAISNLISSPIFSQAMSGGNTGSSFAFSIPVWLIISGLIFTTAIGLISGYLPALKAMKSSALEAIRND